MKPKNKILVRHVREFGIPADLFDGAPCIDLKIMRVYIKHVFGVDEKYLSTCSIPEFIEMQNHIIEELEPLLSLLFKCLSLNES